jgi:DNA-binding transcriptional LysR family regulator
MQDKNALGSTFDKKAKLESGSMKIRGLRALGFVISEGTLAAAAQKMFLSEPAVSRLISELESDIGLALFSRDKRQLVPTEEGLRFYREAVRILENVDQIPQIAADIRRGQEEFLRVVVMPRLISGVAAPAIASFAKDFPNVHIKIDIRSRRDGDIWLNNRLYDIGLGSLPIFHPRITTEELASPMAVCMLPLGHRLSEAAAISPADIANECLVTHGAGMLARTQMEDWFRGAKVQLCHSLEVNSSEMLHQLVVNGSGVSIVDPVGVSQLPASRFVIRPLVQPFAVPYGVLWFEEPGSRKIHALELAKRFAAQFDRILGR